MKFAVLSLLGAAALAQTPPAQSPPSQSEEGIRQQMESSLERQRESVRKQIKLASVAGPSWYIVPWPWQDWPLPLPAPLSPEGAASSMGWRPDCEPLRPDEVEPLVKEAAAAHRVDAAVVRAVMRQESAFYPCAASSKGALGLMQLMPETASSLQVADPFDPRENVHAGARFLASLLNRYGGDLRLALAAYNAGASRVDDYKGVPPFRETRDYVGAILGALGASQ